MIQKMYVWNSLDADHNTWAPNIEIYLNQILCWIQRHCVWQCFTVCRKLWNVSYYCPNMLEFAAELVPLGFFLVNSWFLQLYSQEIAVHPLPTMPNPGQAWWLPWPLPCRQNHHHVHSPHGRGRPPWGPHCHHCPGKALLLRHPTLPEELLWHGLVLNLGAQDEKHPEPKERQWGRCLPREGPWPGWEGAHSTGLPLQTWLLTQALATRISVFVLGPFAEDFNEHILKPPPTEML